MKKIIMTIAIVMIATFSSFGYLITVSSIDMWEEGTLYIRSAAPDNKVYFLPNNSLIKKETLLIALYSKTNGLQLEVTPYSSPNSQGYFQLMSARINF